MNIFHWIVSVFIITAFRIAGLFHPKAKKMLLGRKEDKQHIQKAFTNEKAPVVWFHCASLGEFEQGRPVIEKFKATFRDYKILITFFSPSGYEVRKDYEQADYVFYLPFDSPSNAREFIQTVQPAIAFFIKYEFWYFYLKELNRLHIPVYSVSSVFRKDQMFFRKFGGYYRNVLFFFRFFFVQDEASFNLLRSIGIEKVKVSGDTRFDRVKEICAKPKNIEKASIFRQQSDLLVVGSSWPEDMDVLMPVINNENIKLKFIIAPHEISEKTIRQITDQLKVPYTLFSENKAPENKRVLIIDNIGMLSSLYQYGEMAYIGGSFGDGLHNILEAATYGMPIFFGKSESNSKYLEATDLVREGGAFEVSDANELNQRIMEFLHSKERLAQAAGISKSYIERHTGATDMIIEYLKKEMA